jgi:hypothetical protein
MMMMISCSLFNVVIISSDNTESSSPPKALFMEKDVYCIHDSPSLDPLLSQFNPAHATTRISNRPILKQILRILVYASKMEYSVFFIQYKPHMNLSFPSWAFHAPSIITFLDVISLTTQRTVKLVHH